MNIFCRFEKLVQSLNIYTDLCFFPTWVLWAWQRPLTRLNKTRRLLEMFSVITAVRHDSRLHYHRIANQLHPLWTLWTLTPPGRIAIGWWTCRRSCYHPSSWKWTSCGRVWYPRSGGVKVSQVVVLVASPI